MARYSIRNKDKLIKSFGLKFWNNLAVSLDRHFAITKKIEELDYPGEPYKVIHVPNVQPKTDSFFELYVIRITFDVYNLAYKGSAG